MSGWLTRDSMIRIFRVSLLLSVLVMVALGWQGQGLKTAVAPQGIVSFELAGSYAKARQMVEVWGEHGRILAGLNLGLDYLYMLVYSVGLSLGSLLAADGFRRYGLRLRVIGGILARLSLLAGGLDAIENYALIRLLFGAEGELWPLLAKWCAIPKFAIVAVALLYAMTGWVLLKRSA